LKLITAENNSINKGIIKLLLVFRIPVSLLNDGEESVSLMESLSRVAGLRSSNNTDEKGKTKMNDNDDTVREEEYIEEEDELNEDQKRNLDKSITRFTSAAEAKSGMTYYPLHR